jgi:digeranylgeranylglycerophospholipid reductase
MSDYYDVIIVGGSVSGLLAGREIAAKGLSVAILEEDAEIGTPEHCGGLVSINGLENLGIIPSSNAIENKIKYASISSYSKTFELNAEEQKVIVLDRRVFDKQIAFQTQRMGGEIRTRCPMQSITKKNGFGDDDTYYYDLKTSEGNLKCNYFIDARGVSSILKTNREGVLQSAQYEIYASWIERDTIEVKFDSEKYPGFFAWIIPTGSGRGKIGVAGKSINAANGLKAYMDSKGQRYSVIRKVYAPIWVSGPLQTFVYGRTLIIGDAAGQTKPTTAGGIYTCGMGGILAGRAIAKAIQENNDNFLHDYQNNWFSIFKDEFDKMIIARRLLERLDNKAIDELFLTISKAEIEQVSKTGDFDFHSAALGKILGAKSAAKIIKAVLGNEIRRLLK